MIAEFLTLYYCVAELNVNRSSRGPTRPFNFRSLVCIAHMHTHAHTLSDVGGAAACAACCLLLCTSARCDDDTRRKRRLSTGHQRLFTVRDWLRSQPGVLRRFATFALHCVCTRTCTSTAVGRSVGTRSLTGGVLARVCSAVICARGLRPNQHSAHDMMSCVSGAAVRSYGVQCVVCN